MHSRHLFLVALLLLAALAACGPMPLPTPTAVPLAATATRAPRATATLSPEAAAATPTPEALPGTPTQAAVTDLDDRLAAQTVAGFASRLGGGDAATAFRLYLTAAARQEYAGLLAQLTAANARVTAATPGEVRRTADGEYEASVLIRWEGDAAPATQEMALRLVDDRGLWRIGTITLAELQAATAEPSPAVAAGTGRTPAAPPPAGRLVFQVSSGGDIYVIDAAGSGLRRLTDGLDPAWSPDGSRIAFSRWREPWGIYTLRPDGSGEERVVDGNRLKEAAWSPDGRRLAFTINYSSPGGEQICFFGFCFSLPPMSVGQMWTANLDTGEFLSLPLDDRAVHAPAWDPLGNRIVYAGDRGLAWIDLGGEGGEITKGRFGGGSAWDTSPAFSPDGKKIAYMTRAHNHWEIWTMNADGSGRAPLTHMDPDLDQPPSNVAPAWSPDGRQIAFLSNRAGPWRIYVMAADGSNQRPMFGDRLDRLGIRYEWATERVMSWTR